MLQKSPQSKQFFLNLNSKQLNNFSSDNILTNNQKVTKRDPLKLFSIKAIEKL